ncbi:hypothetical protein Leryth_019221 [Lithospermum erythrorhizon]|nr:hypothetical protein Leryth_019221 [Lithospermum erythrorhizon]
MMMALVRLRLLAIAKSPSRLLSSSAASTSAYRLLPRSPYFFPDVEASLPRHSHYFVSHEACSQSSHLKLLGVRHFSSADPPQTVLSMPALSPTMSQGNIAKWLKKEGDKIAAGDVLCEIETDKATLEYESVEDGFLAKILVPDGSKDVPVGKPIAITVEEQDDLKNVSVPVDNFESSDAMSSQSTTKEEKVQEPSSAKINASQLPPHIVIGMPALSPTMSHGNIATWRKKEGDKIEVGDVLGEIETDKATLEFESLEEGYLAKILTPEGTKDVAVGGPIAITVEDANDIEAVKSSVSGDFSVKEEKPIHNDLGKDVAKDMKGLKPGFIRISPAAKMIISEHGLDASSINASGPRGTLLKGDVLDAIKSGKASKKTSLSKEANHQSLQDQKQISPPAASRADLQRTDSYEDLPNSQIRKVIAARLLESKQFTPHLYLSSDVILDPLLSFRKELKDKFDTKVSVNDIVIKVVAAALKSVPEANAYWDVEKGESVLCDSVDISIAVATEKGLMTPIIRNADQKSISSISSEVKELAEKARTGKLKPQEFQGGTFSISNLGMFPVDRFCAIINPPQAGILAVGRGNQVVEPVAGADGVEKAAVVTKMCLTLSADQRVFEGRVGGAFLAALRSNFSDIRRLLL